MMAAVLLLFVSAVGVLVLGAVVCTPLLLPWPQQVRWTVAAQAMGDAGPGPAVYPPLHLREVRLVSVDDRGSSLELGVLEVGRPACNTLTFACTVPPELESMLRDWCALHTPMLVYIDAAGVASLTGPVATITNLREVRAPAAPALSQHQAVPEQRRHGRFRSARKGAPSDLRSS